MANLEAIEKNYKNPDEIVTDLADSLEYYLDFDRNGKYDFVHCSMCGGPAVGHKATLCKERYDEIVIKSFEDKIR